MKSIEIKISLVTEFLLLGLEVKENTFSQHTITAILMETEMLILPKPPSMKELIQFGISSTLDIVEEPGKHSHLLNLCIKMQR